jgi:hypothetical protein
MINQRIQFASFIVIDRPENIDKEGSGKAQLLGENILELAPLTPSLTNINGTPVKTRLELMRKQGDNNVVVGRLNVTIKLLAEAIVPDDLQEQANNDAQHILPEMDITRNFVWRLRMDVRSAVNLPMNRTTESKLPSPYIELGWTMYPHQDLNQAEAVRSAAIDANRFPVWNQQLLYYPPTSVTTIDGFIQIFLRDRFQVKPLQKITFPLNAIRPFHPAHLDLLLDNEDDTNRSHLFLSITLEDVPVYKLSESMCNIVIHNVNFDPLPKCTDRCSIMLTTDKFKPEEYLKFLN